MPVHIREPRNVNDPTYGGEVNVNNQRQSRSVGRWIVGGLVAMAVLLGIILMLPHDNDKAATEARPDTSTSSSTTGSGTNAPDKPVTAPRPAAMH